MQVVLLDEIGDWSERLLSLQTITDCFRRENGLDPLHMSIRGKTEEVRARTSYTVKLDAGQIERLQVALRKRMWADYEVDHAHYGFRGDKVNVVAYKSGKVVVQGKKTEDFVTFILEGEITGDPRLGYDDVHHPEWFEPHAGLDESGKGDFFGPLVSACVIADGDMVRDWQAAGIQDSKRVTSDKAIAELEKVIRATDGVVIKVTFAGMRRYNELYRKMGSNLNRLLAWMHAKSLENALAERRVEWGMLDQFSKQPLVQRAFKDKTFDLRMQTKAEADPVVAAASIIARAEFVRQMNNLSKLAGEPMLKGASGAVREQAVRIVKAKGFEALADFAKVHFKTAAEVKQAAEG